jgi:hypothetical protein
MRSISSSSGVSSREAGLARGRPSRATVYARLEAATAELNERLEGRHRRRNRSTSGLTSGGASTALEGNTLVLRQVEALLEQGRAVGAADGALRLACSDDLSARLTGPGRGHCRRDGTALSAARRAAADRDRARNGHAAGQGFLILRQSSRTAVLTCGFGLERAKGIEPHDQLGRSATLWAACLLRLRPLWPGGRNRE